MRLLLPELADAAQHAVQAVYGMRAADTARRRSRRRGNGPSRPLTILTTAAGVVLTA
ncbi:hypothetical protein [Streptomyces anulatus]|uniref:hypothetical protein n=1 Tax=Streptomyces anulatus TaxID=1892 RepID=UPI00386C0874